MFYHLNHGNHGKLFLSHSYECQEIQTKNPFNKFLSFDLRPITSKGINFAKDYQKDSYHKTKLMEIN
jgi:hypothetical protein